MEISAKKCKCCDRREQNLDFLAEMLFELIKLTILFFDFFCPTVLVVAVVFDDVHGDWFIDIHKSAQILISHLDQNVFEFL